MHAGETLLLKKKHFQVQKGMLIHVQMAAAQTL